MSVSDKTPQKPTDAELAILRILWKQGEPTTVRAVHVEIEQERPTAYTTTLKLMQIMHDKGLLLRDERQRSHLYIPAHPQEMIEQSLTGDLLDRLFEGSVSRMVMQALSSKKTSAKELAEIRRLLDETKGDSR